MKIIVNSNIREIKIMPGHKCYKLKVTPDGMDVVVVDKIEHADGLYCSATNVKNAVKKFNKMLEAVLDIHNNKK